MKIKILSIVLLLLSGIAWSVETTQLVLSNGLEVVLIHDPNTSVSSVRTIVRSGSIHEDEQRGSGLAHYLEHLVSGGTTSKRSEERYRQLLAECGGASNAYTTLDHTGYYIHTTTDKLPLAISMMYEWMFFNTFTKEEFSREKSVVLKELERGEASIPRQVYYANQAHFYDYHPMRYPVIGYSKLVKETTTDSIKAFYTTHYVPSNMVLVIGGDLSNLDVLTQIKGTFGTVPAAAKPQTPVFNEPELVSARSRTHYMDTETAYVSIRYPSIQFGSSELYALDLLAYVMGNGPKSLLHQSLVEEQQLAYSVSVTSMTPVITNGYFEIFISYDVENHEALLSALNIELESIKKGRLNRRLIESAKQQKKSEDILSLGNMSSLVERASLSMLYSHRVDFFEKYATQFESVTKKDMQDVADRFFNDNKKITTIVWPNASQPSGVAENPQESESPELVTKQLDNGLTVIIKKDSSIPKVAVTVMTKGSIRRETLQTNGLSQLSTVAFGKGSSRFSKTAFETAFSSVGAKAGAKLGNNTWYATMESMSESFEDLFPYFIDAVFAAKVESAAFNEIKRQSLKSIRSREDNWRLYTSQEFLKWFFPNHPYGFSKQGDESVINEVSLEQFRAYQSSLVQPKNTVLSVVGDVNIEDIEADITKVLRRYKSSKENDWIELAIPKHHKSQVKESFIKQDIAVVMMAFDGVSLDQYEQLVTVDVLDTILSGYRYPGGRLHHQLRDKGLVYEVHAYHVPLIDSGYFMIQAITSSDKKDEVIQSINAILKDLQTKGVSRSELSLAKDQLLYHDAVAQSEFMDAAISMGINTIYYDDYTQSNKRAPLVKKVNRREIQRLAKDLFSSSQLMIFTSNFKVE